MATNRQTVIDAPQESLRRRLVLGRLITLLKLVARSASSTYGRETGLSDFDWRLLAQACEHAPVTLIEIVALLRYDKGQVSRALKRLVAAGLLSHEHMRGPILPTAEGKALFARFDRVAEERNSTLLCTLSPQERGVLPDLVRRLQVNARSLLAAEREISRGLTDAVEDRRVLRRGRPVTEDEVDVIPQHEYPIARDRPVIPGLFTLYNLLQRSTSLTFKREVDLSDFDWRVMSMIGDHPPITLIELVPMLSRDKSQVGRAVERLDEMGLIVREKIGGGRHVLLRVTPAGQRAYDRLVDLHLQHDAALIAGFTPQEQQSLLAILDKLTEGAALLMEREQERTRGANGVTGSPC